MGAESVVEQPPSEIDTVDALIVARRFRDATARCAREHGPSIGRVCMAMLGAQGEAEEAAQETLLQAFDAMATYRGEGSIRAWLFAIARRVCARRVETRVRREARLRLVRTDAPAVEAADTLLDRHRAAARVRAALDELKPSERDAVVLRYQGELSYREVAIACGIDEATARKRVSRALERMRVSLGSE